MAYYRLYSLNPHSGHIDWADEFEAADDVAAVARVRDAERKVPVELWQEGRKILRLEGSSNVAEAGPPLSLRELPAG